MLSFTTCLDKSMSYTKMEEYIGVVNIDLFPCSNCKTVHASTEKNYGMKWQSSTFGIIQ